jgi:capsular exopolysaccharide synthesis family protein
MGARDFLRLVRKWIWLMVAFAVVCAITSALISLQLPKTYASTTVALVSPKQVLANPGATSTDQTPTIDQLVATYIGLIDTDPVRQRISASGVPRTADQLRGSIVGTLRPGTTLINITSSDPDPAVSLLVAQRVVGAVNDSLDELQSKVPGSNQNSHLEALVPWDVPTARPAFPVSPNIPLNAGVAAGAGLLVASAVVFILERLDTTIKADTDVRLKLKLPLLGNVFYRRLDKGEEQLGRELESISSTMAKDPIVEQYRAIRTSLMFGSIDQALQTIVVSSTLPGEGKTTTACNLAVVMAQAGNSVILADADYRRPALHRIFGLQRNLGLGNLTLGEGQVSDFLIQTSTPNLQVLCSGPIPPNPSEMIGSNAMVRAIALLKSSADIIIFDTPPIGAVTDATVLGALVDGVILVVEQGRTPIQAINRSLETLRAVGIEPMGVILNKAKATDPYYSYASYYGDDPVGKSDLPPAPTSGAEQSAAARVVGPGGA